MTSHFDELTAEEIESLKIIEDSLDEDERIHSIWKVIKSQKSSTCRFLINIYQSSMWRSTKFILAKAIAATQDQRGVEFLIQIIHSHKDDLTLVSQMLLALGYSNSNIASEFLLSIVNEKSHPLQKSAIVALNSSRNGIYERKLLKMLQDKDNSESLNEVIIMALGYRGGQKSRIAIEQLLATIPKDEDRLQHCVILSLGKLGNEETITKLNSIITEKMSLTEELISNAITQIRHKIARKIEDSVLSLAHPNDTGEFEESLKYLQEFSYDEVWKIIDLFKSEMTPDILCQIKACFPDEKRFKQDEKFILENHSHISPESLGLLINSYSQNMRDQFMDHLFASLDTGEFITVCTFVLFKDAINRFEPILLSEELDDQTKTKIVNVIADYGLSLPLQDQWRSDLGDFIFSVYEKTKTQTLSDRLLRALGQLQYASKKTLKKLNYILANNETVSNSLYQCLSQVKQKQLEKNLLLRLKQCLLGQRNSQEIKPILKALAAYEKLEHSELFPDLEPQLTEDNKYLILRILSFNQIAGWEDFILESLKSPRYQVKILAIVAARLNGNKNIWNHLLLVSKDPNYTISVRAIDSLCLGGDAAVQLKLIQNLCQGPMNKEFLLKTFRSLIPKEKQSYESIVNYLDYLTSENHSSVEDHEVLTAALNLRDSLDISFNPESEAEKISLDANEAHNLDEYLNSRLDGFNEFSSKIKSVLRNAEITLRNQDLFDHRVDKSTIIIELTKSIDLFLNEKIGNEIFFNEDLNLIENMQSRLMLLDLQTKNRRFLIKTLQLEPQFDPDTFPSFKLESMIQIIASGKLKAYKNRCFDGLRSWSLLLLLFGRDYTVRSNKLSSLFPLSVASNQLIKNIAYQLDKMQEIRNRAAHRSTFFKIRTLENVKEDSFYILNELTKIFFPSNHEYEEQRSI